MKKIKVAILGNGDRANVYANYVLACADEAEIVAVIEPNEFRRKEGKRKYGLADNMCFENIDEFLKCGKIADCVFNCTMDSQHVQTTLPLLDLEYDVLLEKPITASKEELFCLKNKGEEKKRKLMICHLLRYTPFYSTIKRLILEGEIGELRHMETSENVGILHSSNSYIRGKWGNSGRCGSGMLLAKCCHDMDYICWLNNATVPKRVVSFGGRDYFTPKHAPRGAGMRCLVDCKAERDCIFSAKKDYLDHDNYPQYAWQCIDKAPSDISEEERTESLKTFNPHGICAYKTDSDIVDHQAVLTEFENGSLSVHNMITAVPKYGREIHIVGSAGEIQGYLDGNSFTLRKYDNATGGYSERLFDLSGEANIDDQHFGGDGRMVRDFLNILKGDRPSLSYTGIEESLNSHLLVYAAEESRETGKVVYL